MGCRDYMLHKQFWQHMGYSHRKDCTSWPHKGCMPRTLLCKQTCKGYSRHTDCTSSLRMGCKRRKLPCRQICKDYNHRKDCTSWQHKDYKPSTLHEHA